MVINLTIGLIASTMGAISFITGNRSYTVSLCCSVAFGLMINTLITFGKIKIFGPNGSELKYIPGYHQMIFKCVDEKSGIYGYSINRMCFGIKTYKTIDDFPP